MAVLGWAYCFQELWSHRYGWTFSVAIRSYAPSLESFWSKCTMRISSTLFVLLFFSFSLLDYPMLLTSPLRIHQTFELRSMPPNFPSILSPYSRLYTISSRPWIWVGRYRIFKCTCNAMWSCCYSTLQAIVAAGFDVPKKPSQQFPACQSGEEPP